MCALYPSKSKSFGREGFSRGCFDWMLVEEEGWRELLGLCLKQYREGMLPTQRVKGHRAQGGVNLVTLVCSLSVSYLRTRGVQMELDKGR